MEENVFPKPAVAEILKEQYVESRLHADGSKNIDKILELQKELTGSIAVPYYVVVDPRDGQRLAHYEGVALDEGAFRDFLKQASEKGKDRVVRR